LKRVAVLGGGYAGCAAAWRLAQRGVEVTLIEAGPVLGGRARRVTLDGHVLDNGQHLLIGAYRTLLRMMQEVGVAETKALHRQPLALDTPGRFSLRCPPLPSPLHALFGLLGAKGLSLGERAAAAGLMLRAQRRGFRLAKDCDVASWLAAERQPEQLVKLLWEPLVLATMNTPIQQASAQVLLNVLRDSLAARRADSEFLLPAVDLSALFPDGVAHALTRCGGRVQTGCMVRRVTQDGEGWRVNEASERYDGLVVALPPHRLAMLADCHPALAAAADLIADWTYQPIYTVYLRYPVAQPLPKAMLGLSGGLSQWAFDRGRTHGDAGCVAVVISAEGAHQALDHDTLAARVHAELTAQFPALPSPDWHRVVAEKRATFACTPNLARPDNATRVSTLWLAGDYTVGDYPATLEGAVRSGERAAAGLSLALGLGEH
jgi:squalene-associated FAD-dependent desaturase